MIGFHVNKKDIHVFKDFFLQFFLGSPNSFVPYKLSNNTELDVKNIIIHSKYVGNLAKVPYNNTIYNNIKTELMYLQNNNISNSGTVVHLSKYYDDIYSSMNIVIDRLNYICRKLNKELNNNLFNYILLETTDNITHLGSRTEHFAYIYNKLSDMAKKRVKFCIDTAHLYVTYYDISTVRGFFDYLVEFDIKIGLDKVKCIHLNNSDGHLLSSRKEHTSITNNGNVFYSNNIILTFLKSFCEIHELPVILERGVTDENNLYKIEKELDLYKNIVTDKEDFMNNLIKRKIIYKLSELKDIYSVVYTDTYKYKQLYKAISELENTDISLKYTDNYEIDNLYSEIKDIFMKIKNIGKETTDKIYKIINNEPITDDETMILYKKINNLTSVPFIGTATAKKLIENNIDSVDDLYTNLDKLSTIQRKALQYYDKIKILNRDFIDRFKTNVKKYYNKEFYILGSYIRGESVSRDIDILIVDNDIDSMIEAIKNTYKYETSLVSGVKKKSIIFYDAHESIYFKVDIITTDAQSLYTSILYFTGSKMFNIYMRELSKSRNLKLNQYGLYDSKNNPIDITSEKKIFDILNLKYLEPNKRNMY